MALKGAIMLCYATLQRNHGLYCARRQHYFLINRPLNIDHGKRTIRCTCKYCCKEAELQLCPEAFNQVLERIKTRQDVIILG
jgi:hypothetical protein